MTGDPMTAADRVQPIVDAAAATRRRTPGVRIDEFGDGTANQWFNNTIGKDFRRAEWTAVPLALGILIVAFGAFLAAVLPVGLALTSFLAANGLLALISHRMHLDTSTSSVMLLVGLAVGVDYCMFYLRREREERDAGQDPATALQIAAATSGRSVLVSGLTVVVAMSGMFLSGMLLFEGFAHAAILVVLVAVVGSVTVLPALLSVLGDHVDLGRVPGPGPDAATRAAAAGSGAPILEPGPAPARRLGAGGRGVPARAGRRRRSASTPRSSAWTSCCRRTPASCRATTASPRRSPAARTRPTSWSRRATSAAAHVTAAVADFKPAPWPPAWCAKPIRSPPCTPTRTSSRSRCRWPATARTPRRSRALDALRARRRPGDVRPRARHPGLRHRQPGLLRRTSTPSWSRRSCRSSLFVLVLAFLLMLVAFRSVTIAAVSVAAQRALDGGRVRRDGGGLPARLGGRPGRRAGRRARSSRGSRCSRS